MKKVNKAFLLTGVIVATIGTVGAITINAIPKVENNEEKTIIQAYNHNPNNILDNVFVQNNMTILPFIFDNATKTVSKNTIISEFKKAGLTVTSTLNDIVGTGTQIKVKENSKTYTVLVYGDVDGDGEITLIDAQKIILHRKGAKADLLTGINFIAANVDNSDAEVTLIDAQRIIMLRKKLTTELVVKEPVSIKEADKTKPVITLKGAKTVTVEVGTTYKDQGATANDNYDGNITGKIKVVNNVNTKVLGTYKVTYNVTDSNGNKATEVVRTVKVVDTKKPTIKLKDDTPSVTIKAGASYTDTGATANDNYDGDITSKITTKIEFTALGTSNKVPATSVDTSKVGTYTITYSVSDSSQNTASVIRTVIVEDDIVGISMKTPAEYKTTYNYGETELDLTKAYIVLEMKSGAEVDYPITKEMLGAYDLSTEGKHTITVTHPKCQATTTFEVTVLNKISALEIDETKMVNIQNVQNKYQTISQEEFDIGAIKEKQVDGTSKLLKDQLKVETSNDCVSASVVEDADGNIIIRGISTKDGDYTITVYITYGQTRVEKTIDLKVKKSGVVDQIEVETINDGEVKPKKSVVKTLAVTNIHGEPIDVTNSQVKITNVPSGITVNKLETENGQPLSDSEPEKKVKFLEILTTLEAEQELSFKVKVLNEGQTTEGKEIQVNFKVLDAPVLTSVKFGVAEVENKKELAINVDGTSTTVPLQFYDQYGNTMTNILRNQISQTGDTVEKQIHIQIPQADFEMFGDPDDITTDNGLNVEFYTAGGKLAGSLDEVATAKFSIPEDNDDIKINIKSLDGAKVNVKCGSSTDELTVKINYKPLTNVTVNTDKATGLNYNTISKAYETNLNTTFTLGTIKEGKNEEPLTIEDMTEKPIVEVMSGNTDKSGINVTYEKDDKGNIVAKGTITKAGTYKVTVSVNGIKAKAIYLTGIEVPEVTDVALDITKIQLAGKPIEPKITFTGTQNIAARDLKITCTPDSLDINLIDASGNIINANERPLEIVNAIRIQTKNNATAQNVTLNISVFEGKEKPFNKDITITVYDNTPQVIDISGTVNLYDNEADKKDGDIVKTIDGKVYTLLKVELFEDTAKTNKIILKPNQFKAKVSILQPKVDLYFIGENDPVDEDEVLEIAYFDASQNKLRDDDTLNDVAYIGVTMIPEQINSDMNYHRQDLDTKKITLTPTSKEITITYVPGSKVTNN